MALMPQPWAGRNRSTRGTVNPRRPSLPDSPVGPASSIPRASDSASHTSDHDHHHSVATTTFDLLLAEFNARWERGESPRAEEYVARLDPSLPAELVELVYSEFVNADVAGFDPVPETYIARFPAQAEALGRMFGVHDAFTSSELRLWAEPATDLLPEAGDEIGHFRLLRELGRGGFARVFLAEQADLDDRLVVVKVSSRITPEPRLLARASHPNIIEVLSHGVVEDGSLQLICMPFLGGAPLSAILSGDRRTATRPSSGRTLIEELDRVSASGYSPSSISRPARELLSVSPYPKAMAWIVARLAEALDFAFSRGVLHGDVKPSNVLLTADCTPMLLDFNLAISWQPHTYGPGATGVDPDHGGTLAYMAPERLRTVVDVAFAPRPSAADRHRADIYGLGVVLLEALTGRTPEIRAGQGVSLQQMASAYVSSREQGGNVMIRASRAPIPAGLRSILEHCLAPDPSDRYKRSSELAEDLDRWRTDRPLAFAREPGSGLGVLRWARRRRAAVAAGVIGLTVAGACAAVAAISMSAVRNEHAFAGYSQLGGSGESGAFLLRRPVSNVVKAKADPAELAKRHLEHYGVLAAGDWRKRGDYRDLPPFEREELEVWLLEQAMRFAQALSERPDSPDDWRRALFCLERVDPSGRFAPMTAQAREVRRLLGNSDPQTMERDPPRGPRWMESYLGAVECELAGREREALPLYRSALAERPASFWANYRAAAVAFFLEDYILATKHLEVCVGQRPENAILRNQYAGCLYWSNRFNDALEQADIARGLDPDQAETFLSRSYVRLKMGQTRSLLEDVTRFEILNGRSSRLHSMPLMIDLVRAREPVLDELPISGHERRDLDPDGVLVRHEMGMLLWERGHNEAALTEFDRVLEMDPDQLLARYGRASLLQILNREGADREFAAVVAHPNVERLLAKDPRYFFAFFRTVSSLIDKGKPDEAVSTAKRGLEMSDRLGKMQAESHFVLARAFAAAAESDSSYDKDAVREFEAAYRYDPKHVLDWIKGPALRGTRARFGPFSFEQH